MVSAFIFDLDGTIFDSVDDIAMSANTVLERYNLPIHDRERYFQFVGNGLELTLRRALPEDDHPNFKVMYTEFLETYALHYRDLSRPYPGVVAVLKELNKREIPIAICTNKRQVYADGIVASFFSEVKFTHVIGDRSDGHLKPSPFHALTIAKDIGVQPDQVYFVGDSDVDMQTALAAGMVPVSVSWGFRDVAELREAGAQRHLETIDAVLRLVEL